DGLAEFVAVHGYGPFVLIGLPMIALLVRSMADEDGAMIMAAVLTAIIGFFGVAFDDVMLGFINTRLHPDMLGFGGGSGTALPGGSSVASARAENAEGWFDWGIAAPVTLAFTYAILLPGKWRIVPVVFFACVLIWYQGGDDVSGIAGPVAFEYLRETAREYFTEAKAFIDWLLEYLAGEDEG
ncbi:MAG: hypothetical protein AAF565_05005, partial [Pseudomonadota bacterium]